MAGKRILVPFNFTAYDERALHYVIRTFAGEKAVHVTLLHIYASLPDLDGYSNPVLGRLRSTMASMWREVREKEQDLKRVKEDLLENGFHEGQIDTVFKPRSKNIGREIVETAQSGKYDTVVITQKPGKATRAFTKKAHDALLSDLKDTEIVIIT